MPEETLRIAWGQKTRAFGQLLSKNSIYVHVQRTFRRKKSQKMAFEQVDHIQHQAHRTCHASSHLSVKTLMWEMTQTNADQS